MQKRAWFGGEAGPQNSPHRLNFRVGDRRRFIAEPHDRDNTRSADDGEPFPGVEPAEDIAREQWPVRFDDAIGPALPAAIDRQKLLVSVVLQDNGGNTFMIRLGSNAVPGQPGNAGPRRGIRVPIERSHLGIDELQAGECRFQGRSVRAPAPSVPESLSRSAQAEPHASY